MRFELPEEAVDLRAGVREVLAGACTPTTIRSAWDGDPCDAMWKAFGEFGLPGLLVDEERGGLGLDELSLVAAAEEAGWAGVPGPLVETLAALPEVDLPVDGSARVAVMREEQAVPYAGVATHVLNITEGTCLFDVSTAELLPVETVDRSRRLAGVTGPATFVAVDAGRLYERAVLGNAAFLLGLARRQLDLTVDYVKGRTQFGAPIGSFQAVKHPLADAVVGTEFAWPAILRAAHSLAHGDPYAWVHVAMAKAMASDAAYRMSRVCLQAHGAMGYTVEYDLHLFAKRTWALAEDWGSAAHHRSRIAHHLEV